MNKKIAKILINLSKRRIIYISDKNFLKLLFEVRLNRKIDFNNPVTFNEKLQWLKIYDRNPLYITMVDKYEVKKYVEKILGKDYIIPTLGIFNKFSEINFDLLPNQFVIKCTHDSGGNVICRNKNNLNIDKAKKKINKCLKRNYFYGSREWPYKNVKPRILIEKYMETDKQLGLIDYKFFCFNGKPEFIYISQGLENHSTAKISFADMSYNLMEFHRSDYDSFVELPPKPKMFEKMKKLAELLSKNIPFVRVDFYEINGKIYFGEFTFFPCSGFVPFVPEIYDKIIGEKLKLPDERN